jgi:hypothetical protein
LGAILLLSSASLALEVTLTRIFSVVEWYHFAFMSVSVALLGFGASGSILARWPRIRQRSLPDLLAILSVAFSLSVLGSYLIINHLPFDSFRIAWERIQLLYLAIYYLALATPFLFTGLAVGAALADRPGEAGRIYFFNLAGSGMGPLLALGAIPYLGGEGTVILAAALGLAAALAANLRARWRTGLIGAGMVILIVLALRFPSPFYLRLSPYKNLSTLLRFPETKVLRSGWNAFSRVDVLESPQIHSAPGLSLAYPETPPPQLGVVVDGDNLSPITQVGPEGFEGLHFLDYLPGAIAYHGWEPGRVAVIEPGGGLDVLLALRNDARQVVAVEGNPLVVEAVRAHHQFDGDLYRHPRVLVIEERGRTFLHRPSDTYDRVHLSLSDGFKSVTSGSYSLSEAYLYTVESMGDALAHLNPDGVLVVTRWLQLPLSESLRTVALVATALRMEGVARPQDHVIAIRDLRTMTILVRGRPHTQAELDSARDFCRRYRFDLVWLPEMAEEEANHYYALEEPQYHQLVRDLLQDESPQAFYDDYAYDVRPTTDDRPFFFHFFKWEQVPTILATFGKVWQPFGGSGYLVLFILLGLALASSSALILLPLSALGLSGETGGLRWRSLSYFSLLGIGYLFVEIPLMQRFILFAGHPVYAFSVVLFALLVFSAVGSLASHRLPWRWALAAVGMAGFLYLWGVPLLIDAFLGSPLWFRLILSVITLAPLGFLMGVPFPRGIHALGDEAPALVPWAWGVNGCASVVGSILSVMLSISFGFSWVVTVGGVAYLAALAVFWPLIGAERRG